MSEQREDTEAMAETGPGATPEPKVEAEAVKKTEPRAAPAPEAKAKAAEPMPVSIWTWVGMVLSVYGVIVTGMGVRYLATPETATATAQYNPSLWWGALMVLAGVIFLVVGWRERKASGA